MTFGIESGFFVFFGAAFGPSAAKSDGTNPMRRKQAIRNEVSRPIMYHLQEPGAANRLSVNRYGTCHDQRGRVVF